MTLRNPRDNFRAQPEFMPDELRERGIDQPFDLPLLGDLVAAIFGTLASQLKGWNDDAFLCRKDHLETGHPTHGVGRGDVFLEIVRS